MESRDPKLIIMDRRSMESTWAAAEHYKARNQSSSLWAPRTSNESGTVPTVHQIQQEYNASKAYQDRLRHLHTRVKSILENASRIETPVEVGCLEEMSKSVQEQQLELSHLRQEYAAVQAEMISTIPHSVGAGQFDLDFEMIEGYINRVQEACQAKLSNINLMGGSRRQSFGFESLDPGTDFELSPASRGAGERKPRLGSTRSPPPRPTAPKPPRTYALTPDKYARLIKEPKNAVLFSLGGGGEWNLPADSWANPDYVKLPSSPSNRTNRKVGTSSQDISRWALIEEKLTQFSLRIGGGGSGRLLADLLKEEMGKYNKFVSGSNFEALKSYFGKAELRTLKSTLESMASKALQLPSLLPRPIPLLKRNGARRLLLTQAQVYCLLANAFFSTFPKRESEELKSYPPINFLKLFEGAPGKIGSKVEKLACIFNYFQNMRNRGDDGSIISFERKVLRAHQRPKWRESSKELVKVDARPGGSIERDGRGMLQVDFANKFVGGGILGHGAVQEEIRFSICPELIAACLFTEMLDDHEVLVVKGCEQFSEYRGYGHAFTFAGNFSDTTSRNSLGIRRTEIVAMDALKFSSQNPNEQFREENLLRELNKAYCAFAGSPGKGKPKRSVATGNWGCGAFNGDPELKFLVQLLAASEAERPSVVMFTFGDRRQSEEVQLVAEHLARTRATVGTLYAVMDKYVKDEVERKRLTKRQSLFAYIKEQHRHGPKGRK